MTVMLGSDDEDQMTTIGGVDLFPDVLTRLQAIQDRTGHPFGFYRRLGFEVVGVIPDANGPGRPDILMAIRPTRRPGLRAV
jgi:aminoglycoside 6'-N-acetyltransferase I